MPKSLLPLLLLLGSAPGTPADQPRKPPPARAGIKTPGIQIPFAALKPEAQIPTPAKPSWLAFTDALFYPGPDSLTKLDPKTNQPAATSAPIGNPCGGLISAFQALWVNSCRDGALLRLNPKDLKIAATIPLTSTQPPPSALAASADSVWILTDAKTNLVRIDPDQNVSVAEIRLPAGCRGIVFGESALWVACPSQNQVLRVDPATNLIVQSITVSPEPESLAIADGSIWALCRKDGKIDRIDPKTNKVAKSIELHTPGAPGAIASGNGFLWVTMAGFPLTRVDPKAESVAQQFYGDAGGAIAISPGAVWLSNLNQGTLWKLDPKLIQATLAE